MFALCLLMHINAFHNVCSNVKMHTTINFTSEPNISSFIYKKKSKAQLPIRHFKAHLWMLLLLVFCTVELFVLRKKVASVCNFHAHLATLPSFDDSLYCFPFFFQSLQLQDPDVKLRNVFFPAVISDSIVGTSAGGYSEAACPQLQKI